MTNDAFILAPKSENQKTGPMAVSTSCGSTCPDSCPLKNGGGCYGEYGPLAWHWNRRKDDALISDWEELMGWLKALPAGSVFRHNQVGDLMGKDNKINEWRAAELVRATDHFEARFTYTHYPVLASDADGNHALADHNRELVEWMTSQGFTVNISANSVLHAEAIEDSGIACPVVAPVLSTFLDEPVQPGKRSVTICPAISSPDKKITCLKCRLCIKPKRAHVIVFPSHGSGKFHVDATISEWDAKYAAL